jgi:hypothetical protein
MRTARLAEPGNQCCNYWAQPANRDGIFSNFPGRADQIVFKPLKRQARNDRSRCCSEYIVTECDLFARGLQRGQIFSRYSAGCDILWRNHPVRRSPLFSIDLALSGRCFRRWKRLAHSPAQIRYNGSIAAIPVQAQKAFCPGHSITEPAWPLAETLDHPTHLF